MQQRVLLYRPPSLGFDPNPGSGSNPRFEINRFEILPIFRGSEKHQYSGARIRTSFEARIRTTFYLRGWAQIRRMWQLLEEWGDATGLRCNRSKTEGLRMGRLRQQRDCSSESAEIKWVKEGEWIRTLGIPIGESFDEEDFWMQRYLAGKKLLATWGIRVARNLTE